LTIHFYCFILIKLQKKLKGGLFVMIKKQQKWIALLVVCTFMWLLQVSTMPLTAANTNEQISSTNNEQGPRFIEEEGDSGYQAKKKSILPIVLIGVGIVAVAAVLILVVFKTSYDIRGNWNVSRTSAGSTYNFTVNFSGEKSGGSFEADQGGTLLAGTYTVDTKNVVWTFESSSKYTGTFSDKDTMSGDYLKYDGVTTGTWTATRAAAATAVSTIQSRKGQLDRD
jgi:hypothetical protein